MEKKENDLLNRIVILKKKRVILCEDWSLSSCHLGDENKNESKRDGDAFLMPLYYYILFFGICLRALQLTGFTCPRKHQVKKRIIQRLYMATFCHVA